MAAMSRTFTLADYLDFLERNPDSYELDEGKLVPVSPTGVPHGVLLSRLHTYLRTLLRAEEFEFMVGEVGVLLDQDPKPTVRGADLVITPVRAEYEEGVLREPPLVVIEVVSPGNTADEIERKRCQYLAFGISEVWIVYPKAKTIHVYQNSLGRERWQNHVVHIAESGTTFRSLLMIEVDLKEIFR
jgi:Uma2 family endonuclease